MGLWKLRSLLGSEKDSDHMNCVQDCKLLLSIDGMWETCYA